MGLLSTSYTTNFILKFVTFIFNLNADTLMYDILLHHFNKHIQLTEEEFAECTLLFKYRKYRKHQYILQNGENARYETCILKGCTRTYEVDDKGVEHII